MRRIRASKTALMCLVSLATASAQTPSSVAPATCPAATRSGAASMPLGHPASPDAVPATQPSGGASIAVQAIQGTKNGPKIAGDVVIVELFGRGGRLRKVETRLDPHGVAMIEDLPLASPFQPRVTVKHAGGYYQAAGRIMDTAHRRQKITVKVYETTDSQPPWDIPMMHVMVRPSERGLLVSEVVAAHNPTDRAWLAAPDAEGLRSSVALDLPPDAAHVRMGGGFHPSCAKVIDGRVTSTAALPPGTSKYRVDYILPAKNGRGRLDFTPPAPVRHLMVFLPHDGPRLEVHSGGLTEAGVLSVHQEPMRSYKAAALPAGERVAFTIGGLPPMQAPAEAPADSFSSPELLAMIGGAVLLALCLGVLVFRPGRKAAGEAAA